MKNKKGIGLIVTVVIIAVIAIVIGTILLVVNSEKDNPNINDVQDIQGSSSIQIEETDKDDEWGVEDRLTASNSQGTESFYICLPDHVGTLQGTGSIGKQADRSLIIVDGQNKMTSPIITKLSEIFPNYFAQTKTVLKGYYRMRGANFKFEISAQSEVKINGYDMVKFSGTLYYTYEQEPVNCNWVAYATQLKSNGAYVYWMVFNAAENKITNINIEDTAYKMALSFKEANN